MGSVGVWVDGWFRVTHSWFRIGKAVVGWLEGLEWV